VGPTKNSFAHGSQGAKGWETLGKTTSLDRFKSWNAMQSLCTSDICSTVYGRHGYQWACPFDRTKITCDN